MSRDYYEILSVARDASQDEIKKAYRQAALKFHPDRNPDDKDGAERRFKEASKAYQVLSDADKRAQYDRFGEAAFEGPGAGGFDFSSAFASGAFEDVLGDLFGDFFGGGGRRSRSRPARGDDLRYDLEITFEDAARGCEKHISVPRTVTCETCSGSGGKPGTSPETCSGCNGAGQIRYQQGLFQIAKTCGQCNGEGKVNKSPCTTCRGAGRTRAMREIKVKIPAGVDNGSRLKLRNEGEAGVRGGTPGDLYVVLSVREHPLFHRDGANVVCQRPISMIDAALGAEVDVPTLDGVVKLKIPAGTQHGKVFRLSGKGVPDLRRGSGARGDQYVAVQIEIPTKLGRKQRKLLEQLRDEGAENHESLVASFTSKLRDMMS
ncbi:MAG TPA: molecular chaperone DnaJ [Candidatus Limnocylindrales bacterium]|nr:molecular chaperone DnaJ [Candidatus Limnocylindrales bacterium]